MRVEAIVTMPTDNLKTYLAENPRMLGVLFTMLLLLSQAGNSTAAAGRSFFGP